MISPHITRASIRQVIFGSNVRVIEPVNLYGCELGNEVFIGPFVEIQDNVFVGARTKIQSHSFVCSMVTIGEDCFIGHGVCFINDLFSRGGPARGDRRYWKPTKVGDNVSIGSNSTILPVEICANVVIGAGSVVVQNITNPGIYAGNPASFKRSI